MSKASRQRLTQERQNSVPLPANLEIQGAVKWTACLMALLSLVIYSLTLQPSIPGEDGGELVITSYVMGIAHPPGYPLETLLGKLFTFFPFGTIASRVNFLSAFCSASAAALLVLTVNRWAKNLWAGVLTAGLFAFSPLVWQYSVIAEVLALNNLLVATLLYLSIRYFQEHEKKILFFAFLVMGLGLSNHHTFIFVALPMTVFILWSRDTEGKKYFWKLPAFFTLGLAPYLYLPIAGARLPSFAWGDTADFSGFFAHLLRLEFGTFQLGASSMRQDALEKGNGVIEKILVYFQTLSAEGLVIGLLLAAFGVAYTLSSKNPRRENRFGKFVLTSFIFYTLVFGALSNFNLSVPFYFGIQARFWQLPNMLAFCFAGVGLAELARRFYPTRASWTAPVVALIILAQIGLNYSKQDQHQNTVVREFGRSLLANVEPGSLLIVSSDVAWTSTRYLQLCEGFRNDVQVVHQELLTFWWEKRNLTKYLPNLIVPGNQYHIGLEDGYEPIGFNAERLRIGGYSMRGFLTSNYSRAPIYIAHQFHEYDQARISKDFTLLPVGLMYRVLTNQDAEKIDRKSWIARAETALPDFKGIEKYPPQSWEFFLNQIFQSAQMAIRRVSQ